MIGDADEKQVRLVVFGIALVAIASREKTENSLTPGMQERVIREARAIADAVVAEAKRLDPRTS